MACTTFSDFCCFWCVTHCTSTCSLYTIQRVKTREYTVRPHTSSQYTTRQFVAIDDVLPLRAARRNAIANLKWFWGPWDTSDLIRWFHLHSLCGATSFGSHQRHIPSPVWQSLVGFCLPCATPDNEAEQNLRTAGENSGPI